MTNTGAVADHRLPLRPSEIESFARAVAAGLGVQSGIAGTKWRGLIDPLVRDLQQHRGRSLIIAGDSQPPAVHALTAVMNQTLGSVGNTVVYTAPVEADPIDQTQSLADLARDMDAGQVDFLMIIGVNPVYDAPVDLKFAERMSKVRTRVHLSLFHDETSELCHWHIPESHYLETWSDARAYDGAGTIIQPLIAPLYGSKSAHELLAALTNQPQQSGYDIVRAYWMTQRGAKGQATTQSAATGAQPQTQPQAQPQAQPQTQPQAQSQAPTPAFEQWWQEALQTGVAPDTAFKPKQVSAKTNWLNRNPATSPTNPTTPAQLAELANSSGDQNALEIIFRPDPSIYDGRFAHNGWLQE